MGVGYLGIVVLLIGQALRGESLVHPGVVTLLALAGLAAVVGIGTAWSLRRPAALTAGGTADIPSPRAEVPGASDGNAAVPSRRAPAE